MSCYYVAARHRSQEAEEPRSSDSGVLRLPAEQGIESLGTMCAEAECVFDGLEWKNESTTGNFGVLSHDDYERLEEQWKLEVLRK